MTGHELFEAIQRGLGPEAHRHRGIDAPARRDTAIAGGSYRAPGTLVDGFRAGDGDAEVRGVVVCARASTAVIRRAAELGANVVITRQAFLGDSQDRAVAKPEPALAEKLSLIDASGIAVLRLQDPRVGAAADDLPHHLDPQSLAAECGTQGDEIDDQQTRRVLKDSRQGFAEPGVLRIDDVLVDAANIAIEIPQLHEGAAGVELVGGEIPDEELSGFLATDLDPALDPQRAILRDHRIRLLVFVKAFDCP